MSQLLPYETIVKASEGDPEAVAAVLSHYAGYIRSCAKMDGQINTDMQEHIVQATDRVPPLKFHFGPLNRKVFNEGRANGTDYQL